MVLRTVISPTGNSEPNPPAIALSLDRESIYHVVQSPSGSAIESSLDLDKGIPYKTNADIGLPGFDCPSTHCLRYLDDVTINGYRETNKDITGYFRYSAVERPQGSSQIVIKDGDEEIYRENLEFDPPWSEDNRAFVQSFAIPLEGFEIDGVHLIIESGDDKIEGIDFEIVPLNIKFRGEIKNYWVEEGSQLHHWIVRVDEVIDGLDQYPDELEVIGYDFEIAPPFGYDVTPTNIGDPVEVFGGYYKDGCVTLQRDDLDYYIKKVRLIPFSEYDWIVRFNNTLTKPGPDYPNYFSDSEDNVWLDEQQRLHLKITKQDGKWYCAEVYTTEPLGYGEYVFYVTGRIDKYVEKDKNVVLGLFNYYDPSNEIDIEFTRAWFLPWELNENTQYAVQPDDLPDSVDRFFMNLKKSPEEKSTHKFVWNQQSNQQSIFFQSIYGDKSYEWTYPGTHYPDPDNGLHVHINLWSFNSQEHKEEVEIIIDKFEFHGQAQKR